MSPTPADFVYAVDADAGVALARLTGVVTGGDMVAVQEAVHRDPAWRPHFDAIWDCRGAASHVVGPSDVPRIVAEATEGQAGRDVLVEQGSLTESLISEFIALRCRLEGKHARVVRTLGEALDALGLDAVPAGLRTAAEAE